MLWLRLCHPSVWLSQVLAGALVGHLSCCWEVLVSVLCPWDLPSGCSQSGKVKLTGAHNSPSAHNPKVPGDLLCAHLLLCGMGKGDLRLCRRDKLLL